MNSLVLIQVIFLVGILSNSVKGQNCGSCSLNQLDFIPGDNVGSVTPTITTPTIGTDGCLKTTVSCDVRGIPNAITYMTVIY